MSLKEDYGAPTEAREDRQGEMQRRKSARGSAKGVITRKENEILDLMTELTERKLSLVKSKMDEMALAMRKFRQCLIEYHGQLSLDEERDCSEDYYAEVERRYINLLEKISNYERAVEQQKHSKIGESECDNQSLGDSASQISRSSGASSAVSSARAKAAAKIAVMKTEAHALEEQQRLEEEELRIQQRKHKLRVQTELAKAQAEESVLADIEMEMQRDVGQTRPPTVPRPETNNGDSEALRVIRNSQQQQQHMLALMQMPKVELATFDGQALQYWAFIRSFDNSMEEDGIDSSAKLARLMQYCTGKAKQVIECCAVMEPNEGYIKARQLLQDRFGDSFTIAETWVRKITEGPGLKASDRELLRDFADDLNSCRQTLEMMGYMAEVNCQSVLVKVVLRLPVYLQNRWKGVVRDIRKRKFRNPDICDLSQFVSDAAEEAIDVVYGHITDVKREVKSTTPRRQVGRGFNYSVVTGAEKSANTSVNYNRSSQGDGSLKCVLCSGGHSLFGCSIFKKMKLSARLNVVNGSRLCHNCLRPGHSANACTLRRTCSVPGCGEKHTKFLHSPVQDVREPAQMESTNQSGSSSRNAETSTFTEVKGSSASCGLTGAGGGTAVVLPILPVVVRNPSTGHSVETYALLDSGSTHSFCTKELVESIGVLGKPDTFVLTTPDKTASRCETTVVDLEVMGVDRRHVIELPAVYKRPELSIDKENMATAEDNDKWPHLRGLDIPEVYAAEVSLLIGQDVPDALVPLDVRRGSVGEPYATKTMLGWALNGPMGGAKGAIVNSHFVQADMDLSQQVERFWSIDGCERLVDDRTAMSFEDKKAIAVWEKSLVHHEDQHYEVAIPFRSNPPVLPPNRVSAEQRLESLKRLLRRDSSLHKSYNTYMTELVDKGFAEKVPESVIETESPTWYLPQGEDCV